MLFTGCIKIRITRTGFNGSLICTLVCSKKTDDMLFLEAILRATVGGRARNYKSRVLSTVSNIMDTCAKREEKTWFIQDKDSATDWLVCLGWHIVAGKP